MTPEKEIVEAAVAWRKAGYELDRLSDVKKQALSDLIRTKDQNAYNATIEACHAPFMAERKAEWILTDLLDKYIGENL